MTKAFHLKIFFLPDWNTNANSFQNSLTTSHKCQVPKGSSTQEKPKYLAMEAILSLEMKKGIGNLKCCADST